VKKSLVESFALPDMEKPTLETNENRKPSSLVLFQSCADSSSTAPSGSMQSSFWRAISNGSALKMAVWKKQHLAPKVCFAPCITTSPEFLVSGQTACQLQGGPAHSTDLESSQGSVAARSSWSSWLDLTK